MRSLEKGEAAATPLRKAHPTAQIEVWALDMLSYPSIQAFAKRCSALPRLDIAILNAALGGSLKYTANPSTGHEQLFQVNYLSTALLGILLLPILKGKKSDSSVPGRLTIVSSGLGLISQFPNRDAVPLIPSFNDPQNWGVTASGERYSVTKTLEMMLVLKLSEMVASSDVVVNAVDPGFTAGTGLQRDAPGFVKPILALLHALSARSVEQAAWTYIDAVRVKGRESHGSYIQNWSIYP